MGAQGHCKLNIKQQRKANIVNWAAIEELGLSYHTGETLLDTRYIYIYKRWNAAGPQFLQCFWVFSDVLYDFLKMVSWGHPDHDSPFPSNKESGPDHDSLPFPLKRKVGNTPLAPYRLCCQ